ncbi:MAG: MlaD family protein [Treponema sp.]|jgi:phospholipid/cholesterol/gamma-HCH transport system substrate-binding protein|nr:MlaD family protein [Treponema sp.]
MKFTIRYADRIVGLSIVVALVILVAVIFLLGINQRWFAKDYYFTAYLDTASGISENMVIQYKGFTFGKVKSIKLTDDDRVEVRFFIYDTYIERIKTGTLLSLDAPPIAVLGSSFLIYPGKGPGPHIEENSEIYTVTSAEGKRLIAQGLANVPERSDSISQLIAQVGTLLTELNGISNTANVALKGAADGQPDTSTELGRLLGGVEETLVTVNALPETIPSIVDTELEKTLDEIRPLLADVKALTGRVADEGLVPAVLDKQGDVYASLAASLESVSRVLVDLNRVTDKLPSQTAVLLSEVQGTLKDVEDVLNGVKNNPLLRGGIPDRVQSKPTGTSLRGNIGF